jgi:hypothetical protein
MSETKKKTAKKTLSRFKGVTWAVRKNKWKAQIMCDYVNKHLGYFHKEEDAAKAYNEAAKKLFKKFAATNAVD